MKNKVSILIIKASIFDCGDKEVESIKKINPEACITIAIGKDVTVTQIKEADIIFGWPNKDLLKYAKNLKWLHLPSAGTDGYTDKALYCNDQILLSNSSGVYGIVIAEHVFSLILAFNRGLPFYINNQNEKKWDRQGKNLEIYESTIGILGLGDIGTEVAKRAKAFGAKVIAVKRTMGARPNYVDELFTEENIDLLIEKSDYIVLSLPDTEKTKGIISKERINKMKQNAFIVNVGRGSLIDQEALVEALKEHRIAGVGLDVMVPEPLPEDHPLWSLDNVIISPHVSGNSVTNTKRRFEIFNRNFELYLQGKMLETLVNFDAGY